MKVPSPVLIALVLLLSGGTVAAQNPMVEIQLRDGTTERIPVDSIETVTAQLSDSSASLTEINFFALSTGLGFPQTYKWKDIDSISFADTLGTPLMKVWGLDWIQSPFIYSIGGFPGTAYGFRIDSITFAQPHLNQNVVTLSDESVWGLSCEGDRLYAGAGSIVSFSLLDTIGFANELKESDWSNEYSLTADSKNERLAFVATKEWGVSMGTLYERDRNDNTEKVIDSLNVSSARYIGMTGDLLYYSYGSYSASNRTPPDAGYYLVRRSDGRRTFVLQYISPLGPAEVINGFDVSPDGKYLYVPMTFQSGKPLIVRYDLTDHTADTLVTNFSQQKLWLRLSMTGDSILYCNYMNPVIDQAPLGTSSEVGILDLKSHERTILNVDVDDASSWSSLFPCWAYRWNTIVFISTFVSTEPAGVALGYKIRALKRFP